MVISSTERRSCLEEKHERRRRRGRREQAEGEDEEEKEIPVYATKASLSCHLLLPLPPSLSPRTQTQRKGELNTDRRENLSPESHICWRFLPLNPASVFMMQQHISSV